MIKTKQTFSILALLILMLPARVAAQPVAQPGIVVTPALIEASISTANPESTAHIVVRNTFAYPIELLAVLGGLQQEGTRLIPSGPVEPQLANATTFEPNIITVQPASEATITVRFRNSGELAPGGHYGSITIRQTGSVTSQIGVQAAVSVGIFLTKEDGAVRAVEVTQVRTNGSIFTLPSQVDVTFQNKGNVIVVPRASLEVSGARSVIAAGIVNAESIGVLPGGTTTIRGALKQMQRAWMPGTYTTTVAYRVDGSNEQKASTTSQLYIPPIIPLIILTLGVVCLGVGRRRKRLRTKTHQSVGTVRKTSTSNASNAAKKIAINEPPEGQKIPVRKA